MSIIYTCRHCGHVIGKIDQQAIDISVLELDEFSTKERRDMIHYRDNGDVHIYVVCENCEESLKRHPYYHELDFFIQ